jgi:hypothetical protein
MGRKGGLLVVLPDPADFEVVVAAQAAGRAGRDPTVHQDQLEPVGDAQLVPMPQHQLAGPVLVGRGGHDQRGHRRASHVDGDDALGALRAAVGSAALVEGEPAVRGAAGEVGVE